MKKFVLRLDLHDDKDKRKALKTVAGLAGIDSMAMDMKAKTLTVVGTVDPVSAVSRLRKFWPTDIVLVGPAKEPEKKEEPKKEEPKKEEQPKKEEEPPKKEEPKKEEEPKEEAKKEEEPKKEEESKKVEEEKKKLEPLPMPPHPVGILPYHHHRPPQPMPMPYYPPPVAAPYRPYYPPPAVNSYYYQPPQHSVEENPNGCVIS